MQFLVLLNRGRLNSCATGNAHRYKRKIACFGSQSSSHVPDAATFARLAGKLYSCLGRDRVCKLFEEVYELNPVTFLVQMEFLNPECRVFECQFFTSPKPPTSWTLTEINPSTPFRLPDKIGSTSHAQRGWLRTRHELRSVRHSPASIFFKFSFI